MELLILSDRLEMHAEVVAAAEHASVPPGSHGRVIAPGETYLGVPYELWRGHLGRSVDLPELIHQATHVPTPREILGPKPNIAVGEVLDTGFQLIRRVPLPLVALAAAFQLPLTVAATGFRDADLSPMLVLWLVPLCAWSALGQAALILAASRAYHGSSPDLRQVMAKVARRGGAVAGAGLLAGLLQFLGLLVLIAPGVVLICRYFAVSAAAVLEDRGAWSALGRSWSLAEGAGWSIFASVGVLQVLTYLVSFGLRLLQEMGGALAPVAFLAEFATNAFFAMLSATVVTALYYALRIAKEAYDLEILATTLGGGEAAPASA